MKRFPLRVRVTAPVVALAAVLTLALVALGTIGSVDTDIAAETLESTSSALDEIDLQLTSYGNAVRNRLGASSANEPFDDWPSELPGVNRSLLTSDGSDFGDSIPGGPVSVSATDKCRVSTGQISCNTDESGAVDLPEWARVEVEDLADRMLANDVPGIVHGFVVATGDQELLVLLDANVFAAFEVEISSGIESLAAVLLPVLLILLGAVTWFSLGRVLSPVAAMREQVDRIGAGSLDQRVPVPEADDDLKSLAETMNRMLDRLQRSSESQRQFISRGDLSRRGQATPPC